MNLDAASQESFTKQNLFKLPGWNYYGSGTTYSLRLPNHGCHLYSNYSTWVGQFEANINTAQDYILEFTAYADQDNSSLVLDNDGINNNAFNQTYTVNQKTQTFRKTCTYTTTGNTKHYFRRNGGGNILYLRLLGPYGPELSLQFEEIKEKINLYYGSEFIIRVAFSPTAYNIGRQNFTHKEKTYFDKNFDHNFEKYFSVIMSYDSDFSFFIPENFATKLYQYHMGITKSLLVSLLVVY